MMPRAEQSTPDIARLLHILASQQADFLGNRRSPNSTFSPAHIPQIDPRIVAPFPSWPTVVQFLRSDADQPPWVLRNKPAPWVATRGMPPKLQELLLRLVQESEAPVRTHIVTGRRLRSAQGGEDDHRRRPEEGATGAEPPPRKMFVAASHDDRADPEASNTRQRPDPQAPSGYVRPVTLADLSRTLREGKVPFNLPLLKSTLRRFVVSPGDAPTGGAPSGDAPLNNWDREVLRFLDQLKEPLPGGDRTHYWPMAVRAICILAQEKGNTPLCKATLDREGALDALRVKQRGYPEGFFRCEKFKKLWVAATQKANAAQTQQRTPEST